MLISCSKQQFPAAAAACCGGSLWLLFSAVLCKSRNLLSFFWHFCLSDGFCCVLNAYQREFKLSQALQATAQVIRGHLRTQSKYTAAAAATIPAAQTAAGSSASCDRLIKVRNAFGFEGGACDMHAA